MPAKKANGRVSSKANQTVGREPSGSTSFSAKLVQGTTQRFSIPSQRRQFGDVTLRTLVTPGSEFLPLSAKTGEGKCFSGLYQPSPCARTLYRRVVIMNNLLAALGPEKAFTQSGRIFERNLARRHVAPAI